MNIELLTERLLLRPWRESDAEDLYRYASDPAVGLAAGWPPHRSVEESLQIIRTVFSAPEIYAMVLRETDRVVGCCGVVRTGGVSVIDTRPDEVEIGYWVGVPYWGQGLASEAVGVLVKRCFNELGMKKIWIAHYDGNDRSRRVAEKCGFVYHHHAGPGRCALPGDVRIEHFWSLSSASWSSCRDKKTPSEPLECTS